MRHKWTIVAALLALACCAEARSDAGTVRAAGQQQQPTQGVAYPLPNHPDSLKFAVIGDNGTGERGQYDLAARMVEWHAKFDYVLALMVGDNLYGSERPQDFVQKFESPYRPLLDAGVKFYASLGNHDSREQRYYKQFNMDGKLYYSFKAPRQDVRFFALESTYMDQDQLTWLENELKNAREKWKIAFFHHPLYSSARTHGSELKLRTELEPLFVKYGVALVLNGHDHVYERIKPQNGIQYFVTGSGGQLREGDLRKGSPLTAKGFDTDQVFMLMEIEGEHLSFIAVSRTGQVIDSGALDLPKP